MKETSPTTIDFCDLNPEHLKPGDVIINEEQIKARVEELAIEIAGRYQGKNVLLVGLLKGAVVFTSDLMRALSRAGLDDVEIDFMKVSSYDNGEGTQSTGKVKIDMDMSTSPQGRNILVVDDIADTLYTFAGIAEHFQSKGVGSFATCSLLEKSSRHKVDFPLDYVGFKIPDVWVEGYGMDTLQNGRCSPHVVVGPTKRDK